MFEIPVSTEVIQQQSFTLYGLNLQLTLRYNRILTGWQFDLLNTDSATFITQSQGLTVNAPALIEKNLPFVLFLSDSSGTGINSQSKDELGSRLMLYAVSKEEWGEAIRANA